MPTGGTQRVHLAAVGSASIDSVPPFAPTSTTTPSAPSASESAQSISGLARRGSQEGDAGEYDQRGAERHLYHRMRYLSALSFVLS